MKHIFIMTCTLICLLGNGQVAGQETQTENIPLMPHGTKTTSLVDRIVAQVEGEPILLSEIEATARMNAAQLGFTALEDSVRYQKLLQSALDFMIEQKVLLAQAILDSIEIMDQEIEQTMEERFKSLTSQFGSQAKAEEALGRTYRELRKMYQDEIKKQMLTERLRQERFATMEISRREVQQFYEIHKDSLPDVPKTYKLRHLLRTIKPGEQAERKALDAISQVRKMLDEGHTFEELARDFSEDPGSAKQGGDLGFVNRGELVPEFETAAFRLEEDEISDDVKTQYGYHIIKMLSRQGERIHVQHILRQIVGTEEDAEKTLQSISELRERIVNGESFGEIAGQYSEDDESKDNGGELGWYSKESLQIEGFTNAMESTPVGQVSQPFQTDFGFHLIYVEDLKEAHELTLENDYERIESMGLRFKQSSEFEQWLAELKDNFYLDIKPQLTDIRQEYATQK